MKKGWAIGISIVFSVLLGIHILVSFVLNVGLDKDIYKEAQIKYEIYSYAGLTQESLDVASEVLIDYMNDDRSSLDEWNIDNTNFEYFNAREKAHMVDVKDLFSLAKSLNFALFLILIAILVFYLVFDKRGMFKYFFKYSFVTLVISLGLMIVATIIIIIDFGAFWTTFHEVFFRNDLWLLNPKTDLLIRMMPERFFVRMVVLILVRFGISYLITMTILFVAYKLLNKKNEKPEKTGGSK